MNDPETSLKPTGLGLIAVYVDDLEAALGFYCGLLGFVVEGEMAPGKMLGLGDLKLYVEPGRAKRSLEHASDMTAAETSMVLLSDAVLQLRAQLEAAGAQLVGEPMGDGATFAMFRVADPAGNLVEIAGKP